MKAWLEKICCPISQTYLWARCLGPGETEKAIAAYK